MLGDFHIYLQTSPIIRTDNVPSGIQTWRAEPNLIDDVPSYKPPFTGWIPFFSHVAMDQYL